MSERNCVMHGALEVSWYSQDVPDLDGEPRCYVCELEKRAEKAEQLNTDMYKALKKLVDKAEYFIPTGEADIEFDAARHALAKAEGKS